MYQNEEHIEVRKPPNQYIASLFILIMVYNCKMTGTRAPSLFLALKQGYASHSNSTCHKVFEEKKFLFFEMSSFFCVTMNFVKNLLMSTGK